MPTPPLLSSLVLYWLKDGGVDEFTVPPLEDILAYPPYPAYVNLFAANLMKNQDGKVDIDVPAAIAGPLKAGVGRRLKDHGIKVVLSILNATDRQSVGWSTMTPAENEQLVAALGNIKSTYGIDGIDIDDEFMDVEGAPENFYSTVRAIRSADPSLVISNPIYYPDMVKYEKYPDLANQMTYCSTMNYGDSCDGITGLVQMFNGYGIPMSKLYAGVRPGPPADSKCRGDSFTSIETCRQVAEWAKTNCAGVMMFTFSTDTIEYTACPQHSGWPNPADHGWQKAIQSVLAGS